MLLEIAVGDAYGAGFEFASKDRLKELNNDLKQYYPHNLPGHLPPGSYTDDTQMSIAISEMILNDTPWTVENLAQKFVEVYKRDPRNGYSRKFQEILDKITTGDELREKIIANSTACGSAMRAVPIGLLKYEQEIMEKAHIQASITHNTTDGIMCAKAVALAAHYARTYQQCSINSYLNWHLKSEIDWTGWEPGTYVTSAGMPVVRAAISAWKRNTKMSDILKQCVAYEGDVDSVSAIALGIASLDKKVEKDLPAVLVDNLENNGFGRDYLIELDRKLLTLPRLQDAG